MKLLGNLRKCVMNAKNRKGEKCEIQDTKHGKRYYDKDKKGETKLWMMKVKGLVGKERQGGRNKLTSQETHSWKSDEG